jgi:hypothetical protein
MTRVRLPVFGSSLLLILAASGCTSWTPYHTEGSTGKLPSPLRATRNDSAKVVLQAPYLRADTLYGQADGRAIRFASLDQIALLERRHLSAVNTIGLIGGMGFAAGVVYLIVCAGNNCNTDYVAN